MKGQRWMEETFTGHLPKNGTADQQFNPDAPIVNSDPPTTPITIDLRSEISRVNTGLAFGWKVLIVFAVAFPWWIGMLWLITGIW